jgi:uracil-DNA glycosylase family 4
MAKAKKIELPVIADPAEAGEESLLCRKCELFEGCRNPFQPTYEPPSWTGKVLVITEKPSDKKSKEVLSQYLEAVGLGPRDVCVAYATRCFTKSANLTQIRSCRPYLFHDVMRLRPKWILALGDNAARAVLNNGQTAVKNLRQRAFSAAEFFGSDAAGITVAFTYEPSSVEFAGQKAGELKQKIQADLKWLVTFKGYSAPPKKEFPSINEALALDIEWDKNNQLLTIGIANDEKAVASEEPKEMLTWWSNATGFDPVMLINHNIYGDLPYLQLHNYPVPKEYITGERVRDSLLTARLRDENFGAYDLESLAVSFCGVEPWKLKSQAEAKAKGFLVKKKDFDMGLVPQDIRMDRCALDAWTAYKLHESCEPHVDPKVLAFSNRLASTLRRVEMAGVKIDRDRYDRLREVLNEHLDQRRHRLAEIAKSYGLEVFSPSNDNHFRELLFEKIGATPPRYTAKAGDPAIGKDALTLIYQDGTDEEKEAIVARLEYEKAEKLYSTYIGKEEDDDNDATGLQKYLTRNFYVFQSINPLGARTGRRSSSKPNMQNWPKRMRSLVVSRFPGGKIVKADFSQLEPRIMAYIAGIEEWMDIFASGKNFYIECAKRMWKQDIEKETPLYKVTKSTILGTNYGMEVDLFIERMAIQNGIPLTREEGQYILSLYHSTFPRLPKFFALQKERLLSKQCAVTMMGQVRHLPLPEGGKTKGFKHMWNQAVNFPIQGTAASVTGASAMDMESAILHEVGIGLEEHYRNIVGFWADEKLDFFSERKSLTNSEECGTMVWNRDQTFPAYPVLVNEVHDELVVDSPPEYVETVEELMKETMVNCPTLRQLWPDTKNIPLQTEVSTGTSWAGQ